VQRGVVFIQLFTELIGDHFEPREQLGLFNYFNRFNNALKMEPTRAGEGGRAAPEPEPAAATV
jgi:hypothetical protein